MTTNWETVTHEGETYKVLNDHAGNLTVTEWREQLEEYVEHMCDKTGIELLRGVSSSSHRRETCAAALTYSSATKQHTPDLPQKSSMPS